VLSAVNIINYPIKAIWSTGQIIDYSMASNAIKAFSKVKYKSAWAQRVLECSCGWAITAKGKRVITVKKLKLIDVVPSSSKTILRLTIFSVCYALT